MTIIPSIDLIEKYTSNSRDKAFSDINSILYNEDIDILLTKNYLNVIENHINNTEILQSLIIELSDSNRLSVETLDNDENNIFEKLYIDNNENIESLFALTLNEEPNIEHYCYSKKNKKNKNKEFIIFELLKSSVISLHYYDFTSNQDIQNFIKKVFKLPKNLSRIEIFNRYSEYKYFDFLKNKSIHYFNFIPKGQLHKRKLEYITIEKDLKLNLGRNLVLKTTDDSTKIHERKIFFNHFIITTDQAFDNLLISEPNWKIDIEIDRKICLQEWNKKKRYFANLN